MAKIVTHPEFVCRVHSTNPTINVIGLYINSATLVDVECKLCSHKWSTRPNNISRGRKCPDCHRRKQPEDFAKELSEKNNKVTLLGKYKTVKEKVFVKCNFCGDEYFARPDILLEGMGCLECGNKSRRRGTEELLNTIEKLHPNMRFSGEPEVVNDYVDCNCLGCGKQYSQKVRKLLEGRGCQTCSGINQRKDHTTFVNEIKELHPDLVILGKYESNKTPILTRCTLDDYEWYASPNDLLSGYGCRQCATHGYNVGKVGYFYVYSFSAYCGFGITNSKKKRYDNHKTTFKQADVSSTLELIVKGDGKTIFNIEKLAKNTLPIYDTGIKGFRTEAVLEKDSHLVYALIEKYLDSEEVTLEKI